MELFSRYGFSGAFRMAHVIVAVMWMGLLWFFNMVQTPAYAEMDAGARNEAFDKLTWRALWWFRWAAAATVVFGLLIIAIAPSGSYGGDFWQSTAGVTLLLGIIMGIVMFLNVWLVIWPNQQVVIGNARNVLAGGEANPAAPTSARAGAMASRQNTIFSLPLLVFMVGASHFFNNGIYFAQHTGFDDLSTGLWFLYLLVGLVIIGVLEANALGYISGRGNTGLNIIYETHVNAIYAGSALIVFFYIFAEILLKN